MVKPTNFLTLAISDFLEVFQLTGLDKLTLTCTVFKEINAFYTDGNQKCFVFSFLLSKGRNVIDIKKS